MKNVLIALRMLLGMTLITGVLYPLLVVGIAQGFMKSRANGDLVVVGGKVVGARLIAQKFTDEKYFWPRPSAVDYDTLPAGGSHLGPTSALLKESVAERMAVLIKAHGVTSPDEVPRELLFASGSGIDPHIGLRAAYFQIDRVAKARGLDPLLGREALRNCVDEAIEGSRFGFLGPVYVNVFLLNVRLDEKFPAKDRS